MILVGMRLWCMTVKVCQDGLVKFYFTEVCGSVFVHCGQLICFLG